MIEDLPKCKIPKQSHLRKATLTKTFYFLMNALKRQIPDLFGRRKDTWSSDTLYKRFEISNTTFIF